MRSHTPDTAPTCDSELGDRDTPLRGSDKAAALCSPLEPAAHAAALAAELARRYPHCFARFTARLRPDTRARLEHALNVDGRAGQSPCEENSLSMQRVRSWQQQTAQALQEESDDDSLASSALSEPEFELLAQAAREWEAAELQAAAADRRRDLGQLMRLCCVAMRPQTKPELPPKPELQIKGPQHWLLRRGVPVPPPPPPPDGARGVSLR